MAIDIYKSGSGGGGGTDEKVKYSATDTTAGYLSDKLTNGYGVTFNIANPGGNESLDISINNGDLDGYFALLDSSNQPFTTSGFTSLDTSLRTAHDSSGNATLDWDLGVLLAFNDPALDWTNRKLYNYYGIEMADWESGFLRDLTGVIAIEWTSRFLRNSGGTTLYNFDTGILYGTDGFASLDQNNRYLGDGSGNTSVDFQNRDLYDTSSDNVLDWENTQLRKAGVTVYDWSSGIFKDFLNETSIDVFTRILQNSSSVTTFDWENLAFPTLTTNGLLATTGGTGTLAIRPNLGGFGCTTNVSTGYIQTGMALRFRAPYDFQASEWFISSMTGGDVQLDILRDASTWPVFTSSSICNTAYPELISGSTIGSGSATTWDPIDKDDYIVILIYSVSALEDFTLQVIGDKL